MSDSELEKAREWFGERYPERREMPFLIQELSDYGIAVEKAAVERYKPLMTAIEYLLEWMPVCSVGSSGHQRRVRVEQVIAAIRLHTPLCEATRKAEPPECCGNWDLRIEQLAGETCAVLHQDGKMDYSIRITDEQLKWFNALRYLLPREKDVLK